MRDTIILVGCELQRSVSDSAYAVSNYLHRDRVDSIGSDVALVLVELQAGT
jgi:hypothetical protein